MQLRVLLSVLLLYSLCAGGLTTTCTLVETADNAAMRHDPYGMKSPFLNCSHLGWTKVNMTGLSRDAVSITLSGNSLTSLNLNDLASFQSVNALNIGHNKLTKIMPIKNGTLSVGALYLASNKLGRVPSEIFSGFPNLGIIDLSKNQITEVKDDAFKNTTNIGMITLSYNGLQNISPKAFNLPHLTALDLGYCGLKEVPDFGNSTALAILILSNNLLERIPANAFSGLKALRWVMFSVNKIMWVDPMAFGGITNLQFVDFTDNKLETLPAGVFDSMDTTELVGAELYENPLRCNCSFRWIKEWEDSLHFVDVRYKCAQPFRLHGKKSYDLIASQFKCDPLDSDWTEICTPAEQPATNKPTIPEVPAPSSGSDLCPSKCKCFDAKGVQYHPARDIAPRHHQRRFWWRGPVYYPHVDCTEAGLTSLPEQIRLDVKTLSLEGNNLVTLSISDLKPYASLEFLNIETCKLKTITPDASTTFPNLTSLYVHHNELTNFGKAHLSSFPQLKVLRIHHNKIQSFPKDLFLHNRGLRRLDLGNNPVKKFDPKCLDDLDLLTLSLRNIGLTEIPHLKAVNLSFFEMSDNNITVIRNNTFSDLPNLFGLRLNDNNISKIEVDAFKKATMLRSIQLTENRIRTLPEGVFDDVNIERVNIELWRNRMYCDCKMKWFRRWIDAVETEDPTSEIRFVCFQPWRIHGRSTDGLTEADFTCEGEDERPVRRGKSDKDADEDYFDHEHGKCYTGGHIALTIFLTVVFTLLAALLVRCYCNRRKGYSRYKLPTSDSTRLDDDM